VLEALVGSYVRIIHNAHAQVMEAENSITFTTYIYIYIAVKTYL